jgi:hypothetical protein
MKEIIIVPFLVAFVFIITSQSSLATSNTTASVINAKNMTFIVIFANKSIIDINDKIKYVPALLGSNLGGIMQEMARGITTHPTKEELQDINITINKGLKGVQCLDKIGTGNNFVDCVKSRSEVVWIVYKNMTAPKGNLTINNSNIVNSSLDKLGYPSLYEKTTSPKDFLPEEKNRIDSICSILKQKYSNFTLKERNWYLANC